MQQHSASLGWSILAKQSTAEETDFKEWCWIAAAAAVLDSASLAEMDIHALTTFVDDLEKQISRYC